MHLALGFMDLAPTLPAATGRLQGYKGAFEARGLPFDGSLVVNGDGTASSGYRLAVHLRPALSTVALPHHAMCHWAVNHLIDQAERDNTKPVQHVIDCPYIERQSV